MADVYVKKELYDRIVLLRKDVSEFVNEAVREKIAREEEKMEKEKKQNAKRIGGEK